MAKGIVREASAPARIESPAGQREAGCTRGSSPAYPSVSTSSTWPASSSALGCGRSGVKEAHTQPRLGVQAVEDLAEGGLEDR